MVELKAVIGDESHASWKLNEGELVVISQIAAPWRGSPPSGYMFGKDAPLTSLALNDSKPPQGTNVLLTPWDNQISSPHAVLVWNDGKLRVRRRVAPRPSMNKIFLLQQESDDFTIVPGQEFITGQTVFRLMPVQVPGGSGDSGEMGGPPPVERTFSSDELSKAKIADATNRINVLADLPGMINFAADDEQLGKRVLDTILKCIPYATGAAFVRLREESTPTAPVIEISVSSSPRNIRLPVDQQEFRASRKLVYKSIAVEQKCTMHVWSDPASATGDLSSSISILPGTDWSICIPLSDPSGAHECRDGLYVSGRLPRELKTSMEVFRNDELKGDARFIELVAGMYVALRYARQMSDNISFFKRFLSAPVVEAIGGKNMDEVLAPRLVNVTVLFCDIRGSVQIADQGAEDLWELWNRMSDAIEAMSSAIVNNNGVIGDFQGDAAMGFWGWPLDSEDQIVQAARAALQIRKKFSQSSGRLKNFKVGIGVAHGKAIAGKLGTMDQFKIDVFGPTVNLASRLESLTKALGVSIVVDERVMNHLKDPNNARNAEMCRVRRIARVSPTKMPTIEIGELLPNANAPQPNLTQPALVRYEQLAGQFMRKEWSQDLYDQVAGLAEAKDGPSAFLRKFMDLHGRTHVNPEWSGTIDLEKDGTILKSV